MPHFAELDKNNIVIRILFVNSSESSDANGVEHENIGVDFCKKLFGGVWVQTSYDGNIRKNYAGEGYKFDKDMDAFIEPQPHPSWVLNEQTAKYDPPIPRPTDGKVYFWDESKISWKDASAAVADQPV